MVEFLPSDNRLIIGHPDERRRFFDIACSLHSRQYYDDLRRYYRTLAQRNEQIREDLRRGTHDRSLWDRPLAACGAALIRFRQQFMDGLQAQIARNAHGTRIRMAVRYHAPGLRDGDPERTLLADLQASKKREDIFHTTVTGPHRDEYLFFDGEREMKRFSSQGEIRSAVMSLKLHFVAFLAEQRALFPVLLFDDILLEMDAGNMERLLSGITGNQLFFTSTEVPAVPFFSQFAPGFFQATGGG